MSIDPATLPDDIGALKRIIGELARDAVAARAEIEKLRFQLARLKRAAIWPLFGEDRATIEQLELAIETLDEDMRNGSQPFRRSPQQSGQQANKPPSRPDGRFPNICRARRLSILAPAAARTAAAPCAGSVPT